MTQSIEKANKTIRVPDRWRGKIHFIWPKKLPDGSVAFAQNVDTAAHVLFDAQTPEESAVAGVICQTFIDLETSIAMAAIRHRIEGANNIHE